LDLIEKAIVHEGMLMVELNKYQRFNLFLKYFFSLK